MSLIFMWSFWPCQAERSSTSKQNRWKLHYWTNQSKFIKSAQSLWRKRWLLVKSTVHCYLLPCVFKKDFGLWRPLSELDGLIQTRSVQIFLPIISIYTKFVYHNWNLTSLTITRSLYAFNLSYQFKIFAVIWKHSNVK